MWFVSPQPQPGIAPAVEAWFVGALRERCTAEFGAAFATAFAEAFVAPFW